MTTEEHILVHVYDVMPLGDIQLSEGDNNKVIFLGERLDFSCKDKDDGVE